MTGKEAYQNFINSKPIKQEDFVKAQRFVHKTSLDETYEFSKRAKKIIEQVLNKMTNLGSENLADVKEIYESFGMPESYIVNRLSFFAANDTDFQQIYNKYKDLINSILGKFNSKASSDSIYVKRVEAFRNAETIEEIRNIRRQTESFPDEIKNYVYSYHCVLSKEKQDTLYNELMAKLEKSYKKAADLEKLYTDFINSGLSAEEYCSLHNLSYISFFNRCSHLENQELKMQVRAKRQTTPRDYTEMAIIYNELAINIKNGVITDTGIRDFDLVDYFLFLKGEDIPHVPISYINLVNQRDYLIIRSFFRKFKDLLPININNFLESKFEINPQKDENGFPIPGTGRILTKEELEAIINYLKDNNIPLYDKVVYQAVRKYANNTLNITRQI